MFKVQGFNDPGSEVQHQRFRGSTFQVQRFKTGFTVQDYNWRSLDHRPAACLNHNFMQQAVQSAGS
ncbi:hypothetical protein D1AOALGA4SA_5268 [Olavius algarvensis Delta 1 endosymbiont]|nr:hypothetical protein D1AOALGA4SA_5268 [Olavius algarvensis Delta 1 endosymbiont]